MATGFCILGPALAVVGLRGDFKRGIIWNGEGGMTAICMYLCVTVYQRESDHASVVPLVSVQKNPQWGSNAWSVVEKAACIMQLCSDLP